MTAIQTFTEVELIRVDSFKTVNTHVPRNAGRVCTIMQAGKKVTGVQVWKGVLFFRNVDTGEVYVTFINKDTRLWQAVGTHNREGVRIPYGTRLTLESFNVKEKRPADKHCEWARTVVTHVKLANAVPA